MGLALGVTEPGRPSGDPLSVTLGGTSSQPSTSSLVRVQLREGAHRHLPSGGDAGHGFLACACDSDMCRVSTTSFGLSSQLPYCLTSHMALSLGAEHAFCWTMGEWVCGSRDSLRCLDREGQGDSTGISDNQMDEYRVWVCM